MWEVATEIEAEQEQALFEVASTDRGAFKDVFYDVLRTILAPQDSTSEARASNLLHSIAENLTEIEQGSSDIPDDIIALTSKLSNTSIKDEKLLVGILSIYNNATHRRKNAQATAFEQLTRFQTSVNQFLERKSFTISRKFSDFVGMGKLQMILLPDGRRSSLSVLSSGERHVLTLLFSATHMSIGDGVLLIDEPELSLHIDWQRYILRELMQQAGDRQIIACTHAPEIAADHRPALVFLQSRKTANPVATDEALFEMLSPEG